MVGFKVVVKLTQMKKTALLLWAVILIAGCGVCGIYFFEWRNNRVTTEYYDSGQKKHEGALKDGKRKGFWTFWHENGQKKREGSYKDGKQNGLWAGWNENGQKKAEVSLKDGKPDGLLTGWYENGQKMLEGVLKEGEEISARYWNSIGEEVEAPSDSGKKSALEQAVGIESLESKGEEVETPEE